MTTTTRLNGKWWVNSFLHLWSQNVPDTAGIVQTSNIVSYRPVWQWPSQTFLSKTGFASICTFFAAFSFLRLFAASAQFHFYSFKLQSICAIYLIIFFASGHYIMTYSQLNFRNWHSGSPYYKAVCIILRSWVTLFSRMLFPPLSFFLTSPWAVAYIVVILIELTRCELFTSIILYNSNSEMMPEMSENLPV